METADRHSTDRDVPEQPQANNDTIMTAVLPFLQLCRLPTVFTALADVFLGFLLVHTSLRSGPEQTLANFLLLMGATTGLYLAGMVFNDVCDRQIDAVERPSRPIPSGRVSLKAAVIFGLLLMAIGLASAAAVGTNTLIVAGLLAACIFSYDGGLKRTPLGPIVMGSCRFLNIIMAASSDWLRFEQLWWRPQLTIAAGMGIYIAGVTWFARTEARQSSRRQLFLAAIVMNLGLATLVVWVTRWPSFNETAVLFALGVIVLTIDRRLFRAINDPRPELVQVAIRTSLLSIIMLDATLVSAKLGVAGTGYAIAIAALIVPALFVGRWIRLT